MGLFDFFKPKPRKFAVGQEGGVVRTVWANNENEARQRIEESTGKPAHGVTDITDQKSDFDLLNQRR